MNKNTVATGINLATLSRITSHALRHEPWVYELELDEEGWTPIHALVAALRNDRVEWHDLTEGDLARMIDQSSKRRHEISDGRIRALYGHSIAGKLKKTLAVPPHDLFHGTDPAVLPQIQTEGLRPMDRQYVHLSPHVDTAIEVGRRKCRIPVLLRVNVKEAVANGICFYEGNEMVWLADAVPPAFFDVHHHQ